MPKYNEPGGCEQFPMSYYLFCFLLSFILVCLIKFSLTVIYLWLGKTTDFWSSCSYYPGTRGISMYYHAFQFFIKYLYVCSCVCLWIQVPMKTKDIGQLVAGVRGTHYPKHESISNSPCMEHHALNY